jgi:hypothetical protein
MLKRFVLATLCGLCLSGITYAQRRTVAAREPATSERQRIDNDARAAQERYGRARQGTDLAETKGASKALRDAWEARGQRSMPDVDVDTVRGGPDRMQGWDRRMGGPERGPQRDSPGGGPRGKTADRGDRGGGSDSGGKGSRDRSSDRSDRSAGGRSTGGVTGGGDNRNR